MLAERAAHQHVARVDDEHHRRHDEKAGVARNDGDAAVLAGGGIVEKAEQKALKRGQICRAAGDAEAETHGKITEPDGEAVAQSPQEMSFWHNQISPLLVGSSVAQRTKRHYMTGRNRSKEKLPDRS